MSEQQPQGYYPGNMLVTGATRSGKSTAEIIRIIDAAERGDLAIVVVDPHPQSLAEKTFRHLVGRSMQHRVLYDQIPHLDRVLGYSFLRPSRRRDELKRDTENDQVARQFIDVLCRRRGVADLSPNPILEEGTLNAAMLMLYQDRQRPASDLQYAFQSHHKIFKQLLDHCTHERTTDYFRGIATGRTRAGKYDPARRLIDAVCTQPAFAIRCGTTFQLDRFLEDFGILLLEGGQQGVSHDAMRTIMGVVIMQVITYVRSRPRAYPRVLLVIDEATNADLIGKHEAAALAETQKMGLDVHILVQHLDFPGDITKGVLTNCQNHEWFRANNASVAQVASADLGNPDFRNHVRRLDVGQRYVARGGGVYHERVEMLADPWSFEELSKLKARQALHEIRKRSEYVSPTTTTIEPAEEPTPLDRSPTCPTETTTPLPTGTSETSESSPSLTPTSVSPGTSSDSSPATRLKRKRTGE